LGDKIKIKLKEVAQAGFNRPLDMCVLIVIDETGTFFYEKNVNLDTHYGKINDKKFSDSVAIVISRIGLTV
jgi:hypothetical protein